MFNSFRNLQDDFECQTSGLCANNPSISVLDELILDEIRQLSYYIVKNKELGYENAEVNSQVIKILCLDFLTRNFKEKEYILLYKDLIMFKKNIEDKYRDLCKKSPTLFQGFYETKNKKYGTIAEIINKGEKSINLKSNFIPKDIAGLLDLIGILSKIAGINIKKINDYEENFYDFDYEVIRFFSITNFTSTRKEKLLRRIGEFSSLMNKIFNKLSDVLEKNYGEMSPANVQTTPSAGQAILVSGDNLKELELILEASKNEKINVYTNGDLLIAHTYPKFREYKNLVGHIETDNAIYDFSEFKGPVFLTKNSYYKTDSIYRGFIYTSSELTPKGIGQIKNEDFTPLIQSAKNTEGFTNEEKRKNIFIDCDFNKIKKIMDNSKKENFIILAGEEGDFDNRNKEIIKLNPPLEKSFLIKILNYAQDKNFKFEIVFEKCTLQIVTLALVISQYKNVEEISLSNCPRYYINPKILECLRNEFKIKM